MFSHSVSEALGYYVYLLLDGNEAFYVGKGKGNRAFQHAVEELDLGQDETPESAKLQRIREVGRRGDTVRILLVRHGMETQDEALRIESVLIDLFNGNLKFDLRNLAGGHHASTEGVMSAEEAIALYDAQPIELDETPVILLRIPRLWSRGMSPADLYEATRGWWQVDPKRAAGARYALAVSNGIVREIYSPESWRRREPGEPGWAPDEQVHPRYGFDGCVASDAPSSWRNRTAVAHFPRGFQGPFRYLNC